MKKWDLVQDAPPEPGSKGILLFQHKAIAGFTDSETKPIIAVLYEHLNDSTDVVEYASGLIGLKPYPLKWELLGGYPDHSSDRQSAVFNGTYIRDAVEHSFYLGYIKHPHIGIEIICDGPTATFSELKSEMFQFLKALRIRQAN